MREQDYHKSILTHNSVSEAFKKIAHVGDWWLSSFIGNAQTVNDVFSVTVGDHGKVSFKVIEVIPNKKIVWLVTDCFFSWYKDKSEWKNTKIVFAISEEKGKTKIDFTHIGLTPQMECYDDCVYGWNFYIGKSLPNLLESGKGNPYEGPYGH